MSIYAAIATLKKRLARAQAERDGWHTAGNEPKYLEASALVEALGLRLEKLELARPNSAPPAMPRPAARSRRR